MSTLERNIAVGVPKEEHYSQATKDIGVCLLSVAKTMFKVAGASMSALGTTSGRIAAGHFPHMFEEEKTSLEDILKYLKDRWECSFNFDYTFTETEATLTFKDCPIYGILNIEREKVGGNLCNLFHSYLQGIIVEVINQKLQLKPESMGSTCVLKLKLVPKFDE